MAYTLSNSDIVQVTVEYAEAEVEVMMNVLHYRLASGGPYLDGADEILKLVQHIGNAAAVGTFANLWKAMAADTVFINRVVGQKVWPARYAKVVNEVDVAGLLAEEPVPPQTQASITKRAELAVPYGVGGIRIPGLGTSLEVHGKLTGPGLTALEDLGETLIPTITPPTTSAIWEPIIYRRGNPGSSLRLAQTQPHGTFRTQRTRIPGKGI
jgi:hypothetical protein